MGFYNEISKYYDYIFPVSIEQILFIKDMIGKSPKKVLDIACGTGGYSMGLGKYGYEITAVDLNENMVQSLEEKAKSSNYNIKALVLNMLECDKALSDKFDFAFCVGNSVVHLNNREEILLLFEKTRNLLTDGGVMLIQIINYDRIINQNITSLPTIIDDSIDLKFQRIYKYNEAKNKIFFKTILSVDELDISNEIPLYPLKSDEAKQLLRIAGFHKIEFYGDFMKNPYNKDESYMTIIRAEK